MPTLPNVLTDIANLALIEIGEDIITNIDASTTPSTIVKAVIYQTIREVQKLIDWPELRVIKSLNRRAVMRDETYYYYNLPSNFLDFIEADECKYYFLEAGFVASNSDALEITYKKYTDNPAEWSADMTELIYRKLAEKISPVLTENPQITQISSQKYGLAEERCLARTQNRQSKRRYYNKNHSWVQNRQDGNLSSRYRRR